MGEGSGESPIVSQELLLNVAEELKLPLLQIARQAEQLLAGAETDPAVIRATAENALRLVDNYALGVRMQLEAASLKPEPVSVSSVLYDAGQQLDGLARNYGVEAEIFHAMGHGLMLELGWRQVAERVLGWLEAEGL